MRRLLIALISLLVSPIVLGDVLLELAEKNSFAGRFTQHVVSADGVLLESSAGQFRMLRPDFFWWQIESPERQLLVAAGDTLTQIDWDLEVVVEREITTQTRSALHWLLAPRSELEESFAIEITGTEARLTPREDGIGFLSIAISHVDDVTWRLLITDLSHQVLEFALSEDLQAAIDVGAFNVPETPF